MDTDTGNERRGQGDEAHDRPARRRLALTTLLVRDYDDGIDFFVGRLGFELVEDTRLSDADDERRAKRWVVVAPSGDADGGALLLAEPADDAQAARVGDQTGGRVFLFLHTDDFRRDHALYRSRGVRFVEAPRVEPYGTVAVFEDVSGNRWDLLEPVRGEPVRTDT